MLYEVITDLHQTHLCRGCDLSIHVDRTAGRKRLWHISIDRDIEEGVENKDSKDD